MNREDELEANTNRIRWGFREDPEIIRQKLGALGLRRGAETNEDRVKALAEAMEDEEEKYHGEGEWGGCKGINYYALARVAIAKLAEMDAAEIEAQDGGKCLNCFGLGELFWGPCGECGGTGRRKPDAPDAGREAEIAERAKALENATNGPIHVKLSGIETGDHYELWAGSYCIACGLDLKVAEAFARCREDIPYLLDQLAAARAENEGIKKANMEWLGDIRESMMWIIQKDSIAYQKLEKDRDDLREENRKLRDRFIERAVREMPAEWGGAEKLAEAERERDALREELAAARAEALMWRNGCKGLREERDATEAALNRIVKGYKRITKDNDDLRARLDSTGECLDNVVQDYRRLTARLDTIRKAAEPITEFVEKCEDEKKTNYVVFTMAVQNVKGVEILFDDLRALADAIKEEK